MSTIIDQTAFTKANLKLPIDNIEKMQDWINIHEPVILKRLFGYVLYKAFITGLAEAIPVQKWVDLRDGNKEYTYNGTTDEYLGIKTMIADYVYFMTNADLPFIATDAGIKSAKTENARENNPRYLQTEAWNDMIERNVTLNGFVLSSNETDPTTYADYDPDTIKHTNILNI